MNEFPAMRRLWLRRLGSYRTCLGLARRRSGGSKTETDKALRCQFAGHPAWTGWLGLRRSSTPITLALASAATLAVTLSAQPHPGYPQPDREAHTDTYHGVTVADPYRWMEDEKDPRLGPWLQEQEALLTTFFGEGGVRQTIKRRVFELGQGVRYSVPIRAKDRLFFMETSPSGTNGLSLLVRGPGDAQPRVLFSAAERFGPDAALVQIAPSPDGRYVAYTLRKRQSRWLGLQIFDTRTGADLSEVLTGPHSVSGGISWISDSSAFYYDAFEPPKPGTEGQANVRGAALWRHTLGQPQSADSMVASLPNDPNAVFSHQVTHEGRYLVVTALIDGVRSRVMVQDLSELGSRLRDLIPTADAAYTFLGSFDRRFWFYTDLAAPNGRVIAIDLDRPQRSAWAEIVRERSEAINGRDTTGGNALGMYGGRLVLMYVRSGRPLIRVFSKVGRLEHEVVVPIGGSIWGGFSGSQTDNEVFYRYLGLTDPSTFFRLNLKTGTTTLFQKTTVPVDAASIVVRQVFYRAYKGIRIPMLVVHKKGLKFDGTAPAYLYGYGAMGWVSFAWFQPHILAWIEMGGVYAQPALPGEGEFGASWRRAGVKAGKEAVVDSYLAAAEWLLKNKYVGQGRLVANGGSLSAPLAAIAVERRPDLFGAATIAIPVLDLLRFDQFTGGSFWTPEFGSPQIADESRTLRALSPYHNVKSGRCAPPTLVLTGELDQTAPPLHSYKYVAAAQAAQSCTHPILLKVMRGAAHNYGRTPEEVADSYGEELAFLTRVLGLPPSAHDERR